MSKPTVSAAGGAMPARQRETTYGEIFLRLMALREAIERTLHEMAALLDLDEPERVAIPVRAPERSHQRREA